MAGFSATGFNQIPALALGVATVFEQSPLAFDLLKTVGAVYLIYLEGRFIRASFNAKHLDAPILTSSQSAFFQGLWRNLLNPKVLVFMLALLPQFVDPAG